MIAYNSKYIGSAIISIIDSFDEGVRIKRIIDDKSGFYLLNEKVPILCKYSKKRVSPWSFSINKDNLDIYLSLVEKYKDCFLILICGIDGIISLEYSDVCKIINFDLIEKQKRISATRKLGKMYFISGSNGKLKNKVSQRSIIENIGKKLFSGSVIV